MTHSSYAIHARGLVKSFGATRALRGLDLTVEQGTILAVLGPNGAGKTTAVRILSTLSRPDDGSAHVAGFDVLSQPNEVRRRIGLTGQYAALDEMLTGRENLELIGRLYRLPAARARRRAGELLERFDLVDAATRPVKTYSGGMRRRLDLAACLLASPPILFLDEPTTGLDPRSRLGMWDLIAELVAGGTTLLLTTQYLEEADRLASDIAVIDHGRMIARGSAEELKARVGGERLVITVTAESDLAGAARLLATFAEADAEAAIDPESRQVAATVAPSPGLMTRVVTRLAEAGVHLDGAVLNRPTLDDVFLRLTGRPAEPTSSQQTTKEAA